ncbi:unnamed protein product [Ambrosiozyma monospora]|uniref:Unnamed protein product n=1 Tax=Ambrosiozyma monospora TaxID=43982 RepID=A0ACB5SST2_AMBMO|nr:unnamed protein product [Ambrosiozyma monospora]
MDAESFFSQASDLLTRETFARFISKRLEAPNVCYKTLLSYVRAWFDIVTSNDDFDVFPSGFNDNKLNSMLHDFPPNEFDSKIEKLQDTHTQEKLEEDHFHHTYKRYSEPLSYPVVHAYWSTAYILR